MNSDFLAKLFRPANFQTERYNKIQLFKMRDLLHSIYLTDSACVATVNKFGKLATVMNGSMCTWVMYISTSD